MPASVWIHYTKNDSVSWLIESISENLEGLWLLWNCADSDPDTGELVAEVGIPAETVDGALVCRAQEFAERNLDMLSHFDEIWLTRIKPTRRPPGEVGEAEYRPLLQPAMLGDWPDELWDWMNEVEAQVACSDGYGFVLLLPHLDQQDSLQRSIMTALKSP